MGKSACASKLRAEGRCRLCLRTSDVRPLTRHRIVQGRFGGEYAAANVVPLCWPCHVLVDHADPDVRLPARRMLRASLFPVEVAHATARLRGSFDRHYPPPSRELVEERRRAEPPEPAPRPVLRIAPAHDPLRHLRDCHPLIGCVSSCPIGPWSVRRSA